MARIPQTTIDAIRDRADLVDVIREYVPSVKKAGRNYKACCPFHNEKTPSFHINVDRQLWYCFGACKEGGDVFKFVQKIENLGFLEAAENLAGKVGVEFKPAEDSLSPQEKERIRGKKVLEGAAKFYRWHLSDGKEAGPAKAYVEKRGLTPETQETFQLGYAPAGGTALLSMGLKKGYDEATMNGVGLLSQRQGAGRWRDFFWNRLVFPIRDAKGDVVGFGARILGEGQPKYINSPDSNVFHKSRVLYGLFEHSKEIRKARHALVCEGYMDVIAVHQAGVRNAVAPLGTAFTEDHALLLKRYCEDVTLVFDPDAAGAAAALRGAEILLDKGFFVKVTRLPEGLDPDEFIKKHGAAKFEEQVAKAVDLAEYVTDQVLAGYGEPLSPHDKGRAAAEILQLIGKQPNAIVRQEWIKRLAKRLEVEEDALFHELDRDKPKKALRRRREEEKAKPATGKLDPADPAEEELLRLLLAHPRLAAALPQDFSFADPTCAGLWEKAGAAWADADEEHRVHHVLDALEGAQKDWVARMMNDDREWDRPEQALERQLSVVEESRDKRRFTALREQIDAAGDDLDAAVLREFHDLSKRLKTKA